MSRLRLGKIRRAKLKDKLQTEKTTDHGQKLTYRSAHTYVLAWLIERTTETRLQDYLATQLWAKLGAEYDAAFPVDPHGTPAAGAGLNTTLRDTARFGQMHLQGATALPVRHWIGALDEGLSSSR